MALALTVFWGTGFSQATYSLNYTGSVQTLTLLAGNYSVQCWGADGGDGGDVTVTIFGGKGGYSKGVCTLATTTTLYIYVGGKGQTTNTAGTAVVTAAGGWNGGGGGFNGTSNTSYRGGGGGGTDVRTTQNTVYANRIIVAGGGGGCGGAYSAGYLGIGGNGGGTSGQDGVLGTSQNTHNGKGGTQIGGGAGGVYVSSIGSAGSLGLGGNGGSVSGNVFPAGGGGGGYYGGGGGATQGGSGGGGSGYIGGVTSATTIMFGQPGFVANPTVTGNGMVIITELCSVTLSVAGVNSNNAICSGSSVSLTTNAISNYSWSTGASTSSLVLTPSITTIYSLTATSPSNCTSSAAFTVFVDPSAPTLTVANTASATSGICPSRTVALTASGATTYTWTGGTTTVTNGVVFSPTSTSGYTVNGTNACGTSSAATSISIHPTPTVTAVASTASLCSGLNLTLTGVGNSTAYAWSGGSGSIVNGVGFPPTTTATYTVIGTSALSCTASASVPVTVVTTPVNFPVPNPGLICIGGSSTLTATGATNYTWTSATQTVYTSTFVVTPNIGTTTYTVTKSNSNCFDTKTISVITNSLPTIFAIVNPTIVCALNPAVLSVGGGQSYTWSVVGAPTNTFTGASPVVSPSVTTSYSVAASDGTCVNVTTVSLAVNPNPTITVTASSPSVCYGHPVTLSATGGINYTWTAASTSFTGAVITDTPSSATAYNVTADNIFGCTSGNSAVVLVNPNPTITATASKPIICSGGITTLSATASGVSSNSYTWDANANGALTYSTSVNPTSPVTTTMIYTVQGHNSFPCTSSSTVAVNIFVPVLTITGNTNTCLGGAIHLTANGISTNNYSWLTSIGGNPYPFQTLNATVIAPAIFTVNAVASSPIVCPATQTVAVGVFFNPTITAVPQRTIICFKESVDLYGGGGATYVWDNGTPGGTITVNPTTNTTYTVTGTDVNGCVGTGTVLVKVSGCSGLNELSNANNGLVLYPNPNNGEFTIQANTDLTLTLVNELGQTIRSFVLTGSNNYKVSVNDLAKGIYFITGQKDNVQFNQKVIVAK